MAPLDQPGTPHENPRLAPRYTTAVVLQLLCTVAADVVLAQAASPFMTGATALQTNILAWRTPVAILLVMALATQSPNDVLISPISRTIIEQTSTKVFFPNPDAREEDYIHGVALTQREFLLLKQEIEPGSRKFLIKHGHISLVCQLDPQALTPSSKSSPAAPAKSPGPDPDRSRPTHSMSGPVQTERVPLQIRSTEDAIL